MGELMQMPLFPLNTVLFPGMVIPLHIFEPRYRLLVRDVAQERAPFGVALIREGSEVGGPATPHDVGTSAYITHIQQLPGGRMNIHSVGFRRFRIHKLEHDRPYLTALVEDFPLEDPGTPESTALANRLSNELRLFLGTFAHATQTDLNLEQLPDSGEELAYLAAIAMPLPMQEKQELLEASDLTALLKVERALLRREWMLLQYMIDSPGASPGSDDSPETSLFSPN